jgi:hypothetical protein
MDAWIQDELSGCDLGDRRLNRRLGQLVKDLSSRIGKVIPFACQDWAATKAAYRFFDNAKVDEAAILEGHFQSTRSRFDETVGLMLVLHDTSEFSFQRERHEAIGKTRVVTTGRRDNRPRKHTICGVLMHSSLVVTPTGLPLGLAAARFWTRKKFKGTNALKRKINPTRVPIEEKESYRWLANLKQATDRLGDPDRCVHISDRESDIYELFCEADQAGTHFLVRTCVDRLAEQGDTTVAREMAHAKRGLHTVEMIDRRGKRIKAKLELRYHRLTVRPPIGKQKRYPPLSLTAIHATEVKPPKDREPIVWKLLTDLPVASLPEAAEKLDWYAMRWKIETFHKVIKSGCRAEDARLRTAQRLTNLLAIYCIVAWRVFWLCMLNRTAPHLPASKVFTEDELRILARVDPKPPPNQGNSVSDYLMALARLGGYLSRAHDPPPGNTVLWRGMVRLMDIELGYQLARGDVGN